MRQVVSIGIIACGFIGRAAANCSDYSICGTDTGCVKNNCAWCYVKGSNFGYCTTDEMLCDGFTSLTTVASALDVEKIPKGGSCPNDADKASPFVKGMDKCGDCMTDATIEWCEVAKGDKKSGICMRKDSEGTVLCNPAFEKLLGDGWTATPVTETAKCPAFAVDCSTKTKCDGADGCLKAEGCGWCYAENSKKQDTELGFCSKDACGNAFGALKDFGVTTAEVKGVDKQCPTKPDTPNSYVSTDICDTCLESNDNEWCKIVSDKATGGVCLNKTRAASVKCDDKLKNTLDASSVDAITEKKNCPTPTPTPIGDCTKQMSCSTCGGTGGCKWCGVTMKDKKSGEYIGGTQAGICVSTSNACPTDAFTDMQKIMTYELKKNDYIKEVTEFAATGKGWTAADCQDTKMDELSAKAACKVCNKAKGKWCTIVLEDKKKTKGGFCLGKGDAGAEAACATFTKAAVADKLYATKATVDNKCSGGIVASAAQGVLLAAVLAAVFST